MIDDVNMKASMYMLISVINREVQTECFESASEAFNVMKEELIKVLDEYDYPFDPTIYKAEEYDNGQYGFGEECAYINDIEESSYYCQCDWRIVPICTPARDNVDATVVVDGGIVTDVYSSISEMNVNVIDLDANEYEIDNEYDRLIKNYNDGLIKRVW